MRPGRLTAEHWAEPSTPPATSPGSASCSSTHGAIDPDLLASVVLSVVYDPLIDLFRDGNGEFDFEPDTVHWIGPFRAFNVDAIVGEVRRRRARGRRDEPVVPSPDAWVDARAAPCPATPPRSPCSARTGSWSPP